ncbi:class I SAM-dependent methyltransferase [Nocardia sp. NPDC051570]|uniref:class I SAM-dependent methyltransferase n=1 Tax=Nocardia sp. NPDC051570 TaxID=3364324 RepID=UPI00379B98ED
MRDAMFTDPRLAAVYDAFDGPRHDLTAYLGIVEELGAHTVIDIGCGTGCLAILLAESGRRVVGVEPAEASLDIARSKDIDARISWVSGAATTVPALEADLAVMTGNVAQALLADEEWARALRQIRGALRPGGYLVFETRRPERRAWEEWTDTDPVVVDVPGSGWVEQYREVTDVNLPLVSLRVTYRFRSDGAVITSDSTLRFRDRDEIESSLAAHGFSVLDVREAPDRPGREFVFVTMRTV